jgi:kynurenine formamidase
MDLQVVHNNKTYYVDWEKSFSIAIPLDFEGKQPNHFDAPPAVAQTYRANGFIGDTRKGGSCNVQTLSLTPHCNGTHTECVGHITQKRISIHALAPQPFIFAALISATPQEAQTTQEIYDPPLTSEDRVIPLQALEEPLQKAAQEKIQALIVRTLPNPEEKKFTRYTQAPPPFFTLPAIQAISRLPIRHLLVDIPSIDKMFDEGKLSGHRIFWGLAPGAEEPNTELQRRRTITEMVYIPDNAPDGLYLLNLQIAPFVTDAAPSNPILFPLKQL